VKVPPAVPNQPYVRTVQVDEEKDCPVVNVETIKMDQPTIMPPIIDNEAVQIKERKRKIKNDPMDYRKKCKKGPFSKYLK